MWAFTSPVKHYQMQQGILFQSSHLIQHISGAGRVKMWTHFLKTWERVKQRELILCIKRDATATWLLRFYTRIKVKVE